MEKAFTTFKNHIEVNGSGVVFYHTDDKTIHLAVVRGELKWPGREYEECFRCERCKAFIKPDESRNGNLHTICLPKGQLIPKEDLKNGQPKD